MHQMLSEIMKIAKKYTTKKVYNYIIFIHVENSYDDCYLGKEATFWD